MKTRQLWAHVRANVFCLGRLCLLVKTGKAWSVETQSVELDGGSTTVAYIGAVHVPKGQSWPNGEGIERVAFYGRRLTLKEL
jgi:hypothetical protein